MKTILENKFVQISISEEQLLVKSIWESTSEELTPEEFKNLGRVMLDTVKKYSPVGLFSDTRHFLFLITPEIQAWFAEEVIKPCAEHSLKNVAYLVSEDLFSQISVEQLMEENSELGITTRYFDKEQEALNWLLKA